MSNKENITQRAAPTDRHALVEAEPSLLLLMELGADGRLLWASAMTQRPPGESVLDAASVSLRAA